jgi:4-amino-4-deoxy-L-arabinose transferase-like glycosyltransferase
MTLIDRWAAGFRPYALLTLLGLLLYAPGISTIPPLDRDEARFAQATRQMLETGDFLRIRFQGEARNKKPAGIYWLQAAAVSTFSTAASEAIWPYRLPSLIGALTASLLTFAFGAAIFGGGSGASARPAALMAALLLASALGVIVEAHIAKTDAVLLAVTVAAQGALGLAYVRARAGRPVALWIALVFWVAEAGSILLKGPPGPALAIVTAVTLSIVDRDAAWLRGLRPVRGLTLLLLLVAPWLIAIQDATAGRFLADSLGQDLFAKLVGAQESHGAPPLSYLLLSVATLWPASLLLVPAVVRAWRERRSPPERFLLAWIVPAWVLLELVPTKLPHYALPLYPALALACGAALADWPVLRHRSWTAWADIAVRCLWGAMTLLLAAALIVLPLRFGDHLIVASVLGALVMVGVAAATLRWRSDAPALVVALALAFVLPAALAVVPVLDRLWLSRSAASLVAANPRPAGTPFVTIGYNEPSFVFLLGGHPHLATPGAAAEILAPGGGEALVSGREEAMFRQALEARGLTAKPLGNIRGLDYSNGQRMVLTLYAITPG